MAAFVWPTEEAREAEARSRWAVAKAQGSCADGGYSHTEYAITFYLEGAGFHTVARLPFANPTRAIETVLRHARVWGIFNNKEANRA